MHITEGGIRDELALSREEGVFLYSMVLLIKPQICLEIGTHKGVSTSYILNALKDNGSGHLWTTDPFEYGARNTILFDDRHWVDFLNENGKDVEIPGKIDFVFMDGLHTRDDVIPELNNILPQLSKHGVIIFHDAQDELTNNVRGVNAAIQEYGLRTVWLPSKNCIQIYQNNYVV